MFKINFCDASNSSPISSGLTLNCKQFTQTLNALPSDRHSYALRFFKQPIKIGRLPLQTKQFYKYIR